MLTASKSALGAALALAGDVVERRNTIPILHNVLVSRDGDGRPIARMTDLDVEVEIALDATLEPGFRPFTVPAHLLREIVRKLPDGARADIAAADADLRSVTLKSGRSRFSLQVLPEHDFPGLSAGEPAWHLSLPAAALKRAIDAVSFAISTEETRYYLNGIFLHADYDGLRLVATDGHRLAKRLIACDPPAMDAVIIPRKTVRILSKVLPEAKPGEDGPEVTISGSDAKIRFAIDGLVLTSKLIDGTFPDYQRVIPAKADTRVEIDAEALRQAVDRVSTVSTEKGRAVRFRFGDGQLTLSVASPDAGTAEESLAVDGQAALEIGFNAKYVLDALTHLGDGALVMSLGDPGSPAILRTDGDHVENLVVLMPMRV